jgi:hypothetical protein
MIILIRKLIDKFWIANIFLVVILWILWIITITNPILWKNIFSSFWINLLTVLPVLWIIYLLIFIFNFFIDNDKIKQYFEKWNYCFKLFISVIWWILSAWPVYLWYPLLQKIKKNNLTNWHIASFIYARAIKIPLFPIMILYFWIKYTIIFNMVILLFSFLIWLIIDFIYNNFKFSSRD